MRNILDWFRYQPTQLKLDTGFGTAKISMPKAPDLDISLASLFRYSRRSELVYACIEKKAQAACDAEVIVEAKKGGVWAPIDAHPLIDLLNKPNPWDDGESFIRSWIASDNFADVFYCEIVKSAGGVPVGLYPLNPMYLEPQYTSRGGFTVLSHYVYYANGRAVEYLPDELMIRRRHGMSNVYAGISPSAIALGSVDADTACTEYVRAFFNNGGEPSGILINKGRMLSDDEARAMQQRWVQRFGRNGSQRGGVAILNSEAAEYQKIGASLNEIESDLLDDKHESRICMAFGVPPILIGAKVGLKHITQNATSEAAMKNFWDHTMSPEMKSIRKFLTWNLLPMFEGIDAVKAGRIRVNWDMSQVMALQPDLDAVMMRTEKAFKSGFMKLDEARAAVKLEPIGGDEGEGFYKAPAPAVNIHNGDSSAAAADASGKAAGMPEVFSALALVEKKTFEYDGLMLGREPSPLEKLLDLKGMIEDAENGKDRLTKVLLSLRGKLIIQAVAEVRKLDAKDIHELILSPPEGAYSGVRKVVDSLFEQGRKQVRDDLARQAAAKGASLASELKKIGGVWRTLLDRITDSVVSRLMNEIQTRAINFFVARGLLDPNDENIVNELRAALEDQSTKTFEDIAAQAANASIGRGRDAEIEAQSEKWQTVEYSAILDANTCDYCAEADGKTADTSEGLPDAPNPDCEGGARCRCFHVAIFEEGGA